MPDQAERLAGRLEEATAGARAALREVHGATKDLLAAVKVARGALSELAEDKMNAAVAAHMDNLEAIMIKTQAEITDRMDRKYDMLMAVLMGEDPSSRKRGKPTVPELIQRKVEIDARIAQAKAEGRQRAEVRKPELRYRPGNPCAVGRYMTGESIPGPSPRAGTNARAWGSAWSITIP